MSKFDDGPREGKAQPSGRAGFTGAGAWQRPEARWRQDEQGRRVRIYDCPFCKDSGIVTLPAYQPGETVADLLDLRRLVLGKSYAYACPSCRGGQSLWSGRPIVPGVGERLLRWYWAMKDVLREQAAQEVVDSRRVVAAGVAAVAKAIPPPAAFPAGSEETFAQRFVQDFARRYPLLPPPTTAQIEDAERMAKARARLAGMGLPEAEEAKT